MKKIKVVYDRERIYAEAEALARDAHVRSRHLNEKWVLLGEKEVGMRLEDRIRRAREYAAWRIGSYENEETVTPW